MRRLLGDLPATASGAAALEVTLLSMAYAKGCNPASAETRVTVVINRQTTVLREALRAATVGTRGTTGCRR